MSPLSKFLSLRPKIHLAKSNLFSTSVSPSAAEKFFTHLAENGSKNMEKSLNRLQAKLDTTCVNVVLNRCVLDNNPQIGLRFFIWAGLQKSTYRHSTYVYTKACEALQINQNSKIFSDVLEAYRMEESGAVSIRMFKMMLNLCKEAKSAKLGLWVLKNMKEFNCRPDTVAYNVVIRLFCEMGEMDEAMGLMREMDSVALYPDMITYIAIVKGLCEVGKLDDASGLVKNMKTHGCSINVVVCTTFFDAVCKYGSLERALELLKELENEGGDCKPNVVTYTTLIKGFVERGRSVDALSILDQMGNSGLRPNKMTFASLIEGLCTEGYVEEAYKVIEKVATRLQGIYDDCYSSLLLSLWGIGRHQEAESLFKMMLANKLRPDGAASSTLIKGLCMEGRLLDGFWLYDELQQSGFVSTIDSDIYSTLLAGLCQESHMVEAAKLAKIMAVKGIRLQSLNSENVVQCLKDFGEQELVSQITGVNG